MPIRNTLHRTHVAPISCIHVRDFFDFARYRGPTPYLVDARVFDLPARSWPSEVEENARRAGQQAQTTAFVRPRKEGPSLCHFGLTVQELRAGGTIYCMGDRIFQQLCSIRRRRNNSSPYVRPVTRQSHLRRPSPLSPSNMYGRKLCSHQRFDTAQETFAGVSGVSVVWGEGVQSETCCCVFAILCPRSPYRHDISPPGFTGPSCRYHSTMFLRIGCEGACSRHKLTLFLRWCEAGAPIGYSRKTARGGGGFSSSARRNRPHKHPVPHIEPYQVLFHRRGAVRSTDHVPNDCRYSPCG